MSKLLPKSHLKTILKKLIKMNHSSIKALMVLFSLSIYTFIRIKINSI
jgi:hypothetical protein